MYEYFLFFTAVVEYCQSLFTSLSLPMNVWVCVWCLFAWVDTPCFCLGWLIMLSCRVSGTNSLLSVNSSAWIQLSTQHHLLHHVLCHNSLVSLHRRQHASLYPFSRMRYLAHHIAGLQEWRFYYMVFYSSVGSSMCDRICATNTPTHIQAHMQVHPELRQWTVFHCYAIHETKLFKAKTSISGFVSYS